MVSMDSVNCICCEAPEEDVRKAFRFLEKDEIEELCSYLELREWSADAVIMHEGSDGDYVGFIIEGKLSVKKQTGLWGKQIILAILEKGAIVGEGAFIDSGPRSTTVTAIEPSKMLTLTTMKMNELTANNPEIAVKLMKRMLQITSIRLSKAVERISKLL
jgi:CRP-like cAMP-binding protein